MGESLLDSDTFVDYVECTQNAYAGLSSSSNVGPGVGVSDGRDSARDI